MGGDTQVKATNTVIEERGSQGAWVCAERCSVRFKCAVQIECGTVVSLTKTGGEYKNVRVVAHG